MRTFVWLARALAFFALFAFALNNQEPVTVHWFFGARWQAPMVIVVLAAFALGVALGALALAPRAWRRASRHPTAPGPAPDADTAAPTSLLLVGLEAEASAVEGRRPEAAAPAAERPRR